MFGQSRDRRWPGRGPGAFTIGAVAAAAVAITSAPWPMSGSLAATRSHLGGPIRSKAEVLYAGPARKVPTGWAPVPFQRAQLSVPGGWFVQSAGQFWCAPKSGGAIFAGLRPRFPKYTHCHRHANYAWINPVGRVAADFSQRKPTAVINGIAVYRVLGASRSIVYVAPKLGVEVGAHGPKAKQILATLSRSPLAVVLAKGSVRQVPAGAVPAGWVRHQFGGVRFATPRAWALSRDDRWEVCGTGVFQRSLFLVNAKKPPLPAPCPLQIPTAKSLKAVPGLTVVTGKFAAKSVDESYHGCLTRHGTRICLSTDTGAGGLVGSALIFSVAKPHHHARTFFLLGLSGSGAQARAVFDSISVR
ncbi:MAG TPA: hypothetical protein VFI65_00460 [Streptosporangiaceae bacterium]|nr:hypothetical protein [Streptosporangiaceae bacterium]